MGILILESRNMLKSNLLLLLFVGCLLVPTISRADSPDDILIIANKGVGVKSISTGELKNIYLKKKTNWGSGVKAVPIHVKRGAQIRHDFLKLILNMLTAMIVSFRP